MSIPWTAPQTLAIGHVHGEMLVMAGAGSGKTAVLAQRCVNLVTQEHNPCGVNELLVVTFTDAAANEMRGRIAAALRLTASTLARTRPQDAHRLLEQVALVDQAQISTLHSFCATSLRIWFHQCNLDPSFEVLSEHEDHLLFAQALQTVLEIWLARNDEPAQQLARFFDVYANSSVRQLHECVARLERTWELTPNPRQWLANLQRVARENDTQALPRLYRSAQTAIQDLADTIGPMVKEQPPHGDPNGQMHHSLRDLEENLHSAAIALKSLQEKAWQFAQQKLTNFQWPTIRFANNLPDDAEARHFKKNVYDSVVKRLKILNTNLFPMPLSNLQQCYQQLGLLTWAMLDFYTQVHQEFETLKKAAGRLSFADLERRLLEALETPESPVAADLQRRYRHILVDEYQDINAVQQEILTRIRRPNSRDSFFIVGDALQSIYGFRGGEPRLFLDRATVLRAASSPQNQLVEMTENFRTLPNLLDALNLIFQQLFTVLPADAGVANLPPLRHGRPAPTATPDLLVGSPIELLVVVSEINSGSEHTSASPSPEDADPDEADAEDAADPAISDMTKAHKEAVILVDRIHQLIAQNTLSSAAGKDPRPISFSDIAILLRSPRFQAQEFVRVFLENGIPAQSALTQGYFAAPEVQEILALLEVLDNPFQDIALASTLLGPLGRFSYDDLAAIRVGFPHTRQMPFHQAVFRTMFQPATDTGAVNPTDLPRRLQTFFQKLDGWRDAIRTLGVPEGLSRLYQESGLLIWSAGLPHGPQRVANLQMLYQRALEFSRFQRQGLGRFLAFLRDLQDQDMDLGTAPVATPGDDAVRIMSIHKSKGLEFPIVIVAGLSSRFNERDTQGDYLVDSADGLGLQYKDPETGWRWPSPQYQRIRTAANRRRLAEEARLLYVAMTRARDKLILVGSVSAKPDAPWNPSALAPAARCALDWIALIFAANTGCLADGTQALAIVTQPAAARPRRTAFIPVPADADQTTVATLMQMLSDGRFEQAPATPALGGPQPADPQVQALITRLTSAYPWQPLTMLPAVTKVTELKSHILPDEEESPAAELIAPLLGPVAALQDTTQNPAIQRGIATHRVLQLLDFTEPVDAAGIGRQLSALVKRRLLSANEAALIDPVAVAWIFQTPIGRQIIEVAAAQGSANAPGVGRIHRELPFIWSMEPHLLASAPEDCKALNINFADRVLVRGVIDLLLATPEELHLIDYKTDTASQIPVRTPMYTRQLRYYAQAVSAILGRPTTQATLLFLSAQRVIPVDLTS
jgi:ATP-dependent helicase/nuclease subunit A